MGDPSQDVPATNGSDSSQPQDDTAAIARRVSKWVWERAIRESGMSPHARLLCLTLSTYMDPEGDSAFPSVDTLAEVMGFGSKSPVYRAKREAVESGYLAQDSGGGRGVGGGYRSTRYFSVVPNGVSSDTVRESTVSAAQPTVSLALVNGVSSDTQPDHDQTINQTSAEDASLTEFLDHIASKVNSKTRARLTQERGDPANRARLGRLSARLALQPGSARKAAQDVLASTDLNSANKSVLGLILALMKRPA